MKWSLTTLNEITAKLKIIVFIKYVYQHRYNLSICVRTRIGFVNAVGGKKRGYRVSRTSLLGAGLGTDKKASILLWQQGKLTGRIIILIKI